MSDATSATPTLDFDHPEVLAFAKEAAEGAKDERERAVQLYYAVRDGIRYDPYSVRLSVEGLRASGTLQRGRGWCIPKAILLAACCRAHGLPARLGFADVRNHLSTEKLRASMGGSDVFFWHGYTAILIGGRWVKATPAFNLSLCEKFRIKPLDFDGREDAIYHPFDLEGRRHMEYLRFHGEFDELPLEKIIASYMEHYPVSTREWLAGREGGALPGDFERDIEAEAREAREASSVSQGQGQ